MSTIPENGYVYMLDSNKVVYMPTCLLFHMIVKCFSQLSIGNMAGSIDAVISDLQRMMGRLAENFWATARASEQNRILHFPGDWKTDRVRMRNMLNNFVSRVGYLGELVGRMDRRNLFGAVERLSHSWTTLARILDGKNTRDMENATKLPCISYFRSENHDSWKQTMALTLLSLDAEASKLLPNRRLILLCHRRVRTALFNEIEGIERKRCLHTLFSPDKILCVYNDDTPVTCPTCAKMTAVDNNVTRQSVRKPFLRDSRSRAMSVVNEHPDAAAVGALAIPASLRDNGG